MRAEAVLSRHRRTRYATAPDRERRRAGSLHPAGMPLPCQNGRKLRSPAVTHARAGPHEPQQQFVAEYQGGGRPCGDHDAWHAVADAGGKVGG